MTAQALVIGIITGAAYGLVALGLVLVYKSSGVLNFAQGEFGTVAVYALWLGTTHGIPYVLAVLIALGVAAVFGFVTERVVVRPLADAPRVTVLVATAGVALLAVGLELWIGQAQIRPIAPALRRQDRLRILNVYISDQRLLIILTVVVVALVLRWVFTRTFLGLAVLAASEEPTGTRLMGVRVERLSSAVWVLAALLGGVAGVLTGPLSGFGPGFLTSSALVAGFTAAVIGGFTSLPGAFLGGVVVGVIQSLATSASWLADVPGPQTAALFVLLVVILLARPQGILGRAS
ncbi:MAG: branched-chain amino acid ABC transporter permease [Acidobacteria bacterium]|nr:branched-chain amino acid ABC transporter permease [Acidobacteriota bacterium]